LTIQSFSKLDICNQFKLDFSIMMTIPNIENNYDNSLLIAIK
jgi:hypothetical protein